MKENGHRTSKWTVFFTMILHPGKGWIRVGNAYASRKSAAEWLPFVRGAWRGCRARISQCTLRLQGDELSEASKRRLDRQYNLDVPGCAGVSARPDVRGVPTPSQAGRTTG